MSTSFEIDTWVIRCQGLPRRTTIHQEYSFHLVKFFNGCNFKNGVESIHYSTDRRDEVFIEMASRNDLQKALKKDKKYFESYGVRVLRGDFYRLAVSETNYVPKCFVEAAVKRKIEQENVASATKYGAILEELKNKNEKLTNDIKAANLEKIKMKEVQDRSKEVVLLAKLVLKNNSQVEKLEVENRKLRRDLEKKLNEPKEIKQDEDNNNSVLRPLETTGTGMNEPEPVVSSDSNVTTYDFESPKAMPNAKIELAPSKAENFEFSSPEKAQKAKGAICLSPVKEYFEFSSPEEAQKANDPATWGEWREPSRQSQNWRFASVPLPPSKASTVHPRSSLGDPAIVPTSSSSTLELSPYFAPTSSKRPREEKEIEDDSGKKARKDPSETATGIMVEQPVVASVALEKLLNDAMNENAKMKTDKSRMLKLMAMAKNKIMELEKENKNLKDVSVAGGQQPQPTALDKLIAETMTKAHPTQQKEVAQQELPQTATLHPTSKKVRTSNVQWNTPIASIIPGPSGLEEPLHPTWQKPKPPHIMFGLEGKYGLVETLQKVKDSVNKNNAERKEDVTEIVLSSSSSEDDEKKIVSNVKNAVIVGDPDVIIVDDDNINQDLILNEPAQQCEVEVVQLSSGGEEETHADAGEEETVLEYKKR